MANTKTFDVRVKQKFDTLSKYQENNPILLKGEIAFAKDEDDYNLYLGDGVTEFNLLTPIFSTKFIVGIDKMNMPVVQLQPGNWVNNEYPVQVAGITADESKQLVLPVFSQASKEIAESCKIDFYINNNAEIVFTCRTVPTEVVTAYISIFGATQDSSNSLPIIRTDIDTVLSLTSTNPVENKVITSKVNDIEATLRSITGDESEPNNTTSLPAISNTLNNTISYSNTPTKVGTLTVDGGTTKEEIDRIVIPFNITVNRENLNPDSDISCFAINNSQTINMEKLTNAYWTGKASTGEFFGSCPIIINSTGKINLVSVPVSETEYTLNGIVTVEYV